MSATIREIVDEALEYMGEIPGPGVQTFSEDKMFRAVIRGFDLLFKRRAWEQYRKWFQLTLDGTLGIVTTDALEMVLDFEDFLGVYRDGETKPMPILRASANPYAFGSTTSTRPLYWTSLHVTDANYAKRKLQIYPKTATGLINVFARAYPLLPENEEWDWQDIMYLDKTLLMYAGAVELLSSDDLNASAASIAQGAMEIKYKTIIGALSDHPIPISGDSGIPNEWQTLS